MHLSHIAEENLKGIVHEAKITKGTEKELAELIHGIWKGKQKEKTKEAEHKITIQDRKGGKTE